MIRATQAHEVALLPDIERSAGEAFLAIPELAWIASDAVMSEAEHQRFVETGTSLVAEQGGAVCAFLCAEPFADGWHIWELAVRAQVQGQGLGGALMSELLAQARAACAPAATLTTFTEVAFNAPFYARLGFEQLTDEMLTPRLRDVLTAEAAHGLPIERRCAMRLVLSS